MIDFRAKFNQSLPFDEYLNRHGTVEQSRRWADMLDRCHLSAEHRELLRGFSRDMKVLCMAGAWCGDCIVQCPALEIIARESPCIELRFVDRDADAALSQALRICGGSRVPVVVFLSEDFQECGRYGDRTLSRYRTMVAEQLGTACPTGLTAGPDQQAGMLYDWMVEFERIQLMLRLSPRLRALHGD